MKKLFVYIVSFYPTEDRPHHGIFFRDHAEALAEFEDVAVLFVRTPSVKESKRIRPGIRIEHLNNVYQCRIDQPVLTHRSQWLIDQAAQKALEKGLDEIESYFERSPDLFIGQTSLPPGQYAQWLHEDTGIPYGVINHFSFLSDMLTKQRDQISSVYRDASFIGTVSDFLTEKITGAGVPAENVHTVGNVLGREFEMADFTPPPATSDPFKWIWIGPDDVPKKGVDLLAEIFRSIDRNDWKLTIVGDGDFHEFRDPIIKDKVTIRQGVPRTEMVTLMQQHHALISTSRIETFGMAILEMLSLGRPVVATQCGGPEEWIPDFAGEIVPSEDIDALKKGVSSVMDRYDSFDQSRIREYIVNRFGAAAYYQKLKPLFSKALNETA